MLFDGLNISAKFAEFLLSLPAVLWAITFHEFCHGYAALKCGDHTAYVDGRLSLNPLHHFDPLGAICLLLFHFGWAKPVPIDVRYFRHPRIDLIIVSLAGVFGNILTAFVCVKLWRYFPGLFTSYGAKQFIQIMILMNVYLAAFNLMPVPPLDGSRVLFVLLPGRWLKIIYCVLEEFGLYIILGLIFFDVVDVIMAPIVSAIIYIISL